MGKALVALLSVYHKDGIIEFARELIALGFSIYASGGTARHLKEAGLEVTDIASMVGDPILGHRVVTLSRQIHAGLLARDTEADIAELCRLGIPRIDLVCCDLYPLETEIAKTESTKESVIEQTDIGGPTMIRSAAKGGRLVVCDPHDRQKVIDWLKAGQPEGDFIDELCAKGEFVISRYCLASAMYRGKGRYAGILGERVATCKYGENAWQAPAALFTTHTDDPLALDKFKLIEGTPPSYNNYCDIDRLLQTMTHIAAASLNYKGIVPYTAIGAKHGNTCGAATGYLIETKAQILQSTIDGDPLAIFGGLIMTNFAIDKELAEVLSGKMLDGIIAPEVSEEAIAKLRRKGDKCRFLINPALKGSEDCSHLDIGTRFRYVRGGFLYQPNYTFVPDLCAEYVTQKGRMTIVQEDLNLLLAWAIGSTSNSNTITLVKNGMLIGNGVGQQDRVGAAQLAINRAKRSGHHIEGAVAYSDSFFPFPDAPQVLIDAGVTAILTTSGSIRDKETIALCQKEGIVLFMIPDALGRGFFGH